MLVVGVSWPEKAPRYYRGAFLVFTRISCSFMQKFDWSEARLKHSPRRIALLEQLHTQPISEVEYVEQFQLIRGSSKSPRNYSPSNLRREYRKLKERFGFFQ